MPSSAPSSPAPEGGFDGDRRRVHVPLRHGRQFPTGGGPYGVRLVAAVGDGWAKGARINGRLVGPAVDWVIVGTDGYAQIDVRAQLRTDDGADLYIHYTGSLEMNAAVMGAVQGEAETRSATSTGTRTSGSNQARSSTSGSTGRCSSDRVAWRPTASNTRSTGSSEAATTPPARRHTA